ncbi:MAG: helix-turn-helix domain-containing protein [Candidatus Omnitrophica bacterium]|jgi:transcriptional regulator with XRE-family HTH domain|nr:helix-turn-helix domain-containing protein [Candidatus Omnitrophota bacterium]
MDKSIYTKTYARLIGKLKKAREEAKLKQKDVAKRLKRTQSYVSKIESGQSRLDIVQLKEIAQVYKKNLEFFIK